MSKKPKGEVKDSAEDLGSVKIKAGDDAARWSGLVSSLKRFEGDFRGAAKATIARYADERPSETELQNRKDKRINILWSNTQTLMAHLCVDLGTPDVRRMLTQAGKKTRIAKTAASVIEKVLTVEAHAYDVAHEFEEGIEDHLLPGRGVAWVELDEAKDEDGEMNWFSARIVHVPWDRYLEGPAEHWSEVPWVGREHLFDRADLEAAFPGDADDIPLNYEMSSGSTDGKSTGLDDDFKRALVYEIWVKGTQQRIYFAEGHDTILKADDDPYQIQGFFPCGRPLIAVQSGKGRLPTPLYWMYADQCAELDRLATRSYRLIETLKYCGLYGYAGSEADGGLPDINDLEDGEFKPIKNAGLLMDKGGIDALFMVRDLTKIVPALEGVMKKKDDVVQDIYNITGIADIMRGQTNPNETYGAQALKSRFGSSRSQRWQRKVQRWVRDSYRIKAEIIAEHYPREQLEAMTGILMPTREMQDKARNAIDQLKQWQAQVQEQQQAFMQAQKAMQGPGPGQAPGMPGQPPMGAGGPPMGAPMGAPPQMPPIDPDSLQDLQATIAAIAWEDVRAVLRSNARRMFNVDVETDDTAFVDEETAKSNAVEFMTAFSKVLQELIPAVQANPVLIPLAKEMAVFTCDAYKVGEAFEDVIGETFDKLEKAPPQAAKPDPKAQADAAKIEAVKQTTQSRLQNDQQSAAMKQQEHAATMAERTRDAQQDEQIHQMDMKARMEEMQANHEKLALQIQEMTAKLAAAGLPAQPLAARAQPMAA